MQTSTVLTIWIGIVLVALLTTVFIGRRIILRCERFYLEDSRRFPEEKEHVPDLKGLREWIRWRMNPIPDADPISVMFQRNPWVAVVYAGVVNLLVAQMVVVLMLIVLILSSARMIHCPGSLTACVELQALGGGYTYQEFAAAAFLAIGWATVAADVVLLVLIATPFTPRHFVDVMARHLILGMYRQGSTASLERACSTFRRRLRSFVLGILMISVGIFFYFSMHLIIEGATKFVIFREVHILFFGFGIFSTALAPIALLGGATLLFLVFYRPVRDAFGGSAAESSSRGV